MHLRTTALALYAQKKLTVSTTHSLPVLTILLVLQNVSMTKAHGMASKAAIETFEAETKVFEEGSTANKFYFVYSGSLRVEKTKEKEGFVEVGHLHPGDYFGELALINDSPRLATVTSQNHVILLSITRDHFHECFENMAETNVLRGDDLYKCSECQALRDAEQTLELW